MRLNGILIPPGKRLNDRVLERIGHDSGTILFFPDVLVLHTHDYRTSPLVTGSSLSPR